MTEIEIPRNRRESNSQVAKKPQAKGRRFVGWYEMEMSTQLWINLGCTFFWFFIVYFGVMFAFTSVMYVNQMSEKVDDQMNQILRNRIEYSTQALATMFYMIDKLGVDSSIRLSEMYKKAAELNPFPIKEDAPGYELYEQSVWNKGEKVYNAGATCQNNDIAPAPMKQLKHIWE